MVTVTITDKRLQILTYARHLWPSSSEVSLARHTYCKIRFLMVISEDYLIAERLVVELSKHVFTT